ncbi:MAG: VOC family protein [Butyrivibrio sp.]|nr:VOC family protein [Butyrivibrio sp.]
MNIHHVGYLTKDLNKAQDEFLALGFVVEQEKAYDEHRKINISFIVNGNYRVELIEPVDDSSPMYPLLKRYKNTPYHICYEVYDLEASIAELSTKGYTVMQEPLEAPCIENKRVSFLINSNLGIIELVETN